MPWLKQLADVARRTGFPVVEVPGWQKRGHGEQPTVEGVVCHHTAGRGDLHVVRDGRPGLSGPLAQFWLQRTGTIYVVAAGKCYHNHPSTSPHHDNSHAVGIEAENTGSEPWPAVQLQAYRALCAELCREFELPASRVVGHKEVQPGKPDPAGISMTAFRADVARLLAAKPGGAKPAELPEAGPPPHFRRQLKLTTPYMQGEDIREWQAQARRFVPPLVVDGVYGPKSRAACQAIQRKVRLSVTGVVTAETWLLTWIWEPAEKGAS